MAALKTILFGIALVAEPAAARSSDPVSRWSAEITEASARFDVPVVWIERVMRAESGGMTMVRGRPIISRAGAMGLMQLMPQTWLEMRAALRLGRDPHHPRDNILAGTAYLRAMYDRFGYPGLFAAYNAGPGRYEASLASGRPLPAETRAYLATVTAVSAGSPRPPMPPQALFVALQSSDAVAEPSPLRAAEKAPDNLFAIRPPR